MWKRYEESFSREKKDTKLQYNKKQQQQKKYAQEYIVPRTIIIIIIKRVWIIELKKNRH